jgi:hypothetical protein
MKRSNVDRHSQELCRQVLMFLLQARRGEIASALQRGGYDLAAQTDGFRLLYEAADDACQAEPHPKSTAYSTLRAWWSRWSAVALVGGAP